MRARFKVSIECITVIVFAILGRVVAANFWAGFVNATSVVFLKMFALGMNQNEPIVALGENAGEFMKQIPPQIVKIRGGFRSVDCQRKVTTAFGRAVITEDFAGF